MSTKKNSRGAEEDELLLVEKKEIVPTFWQKVYYIVYAIMLSTAAPLFCIASFITYWCTPSYGFGFVIGCYFFFVFLWPGTNYVKRIGSYFAQEVSAEKHHTPLLQIFKRIAISTSFMFFVVIWTSLIQNQIIWSPQFTNYLHQMIAYFTPQFPAYWNSMWSNSEPTDTIYPTAQSILRVLKMTLAYAVLYLVHFIGFGQIPEYLREWWELIRKSAEELWRQEQARRNVTLLKKK